MRRRVSAGGARGGRAGGALRNGRALLSDCGAADAADDRSDNFLGITIPKDFPLRVDLTLSNALAVDACGGAFSGTGAGGAFGASSGQIEADAGEPCVISETYSIEIAVESIFADAEFLFEAELNGSGRRRRAERTRSK